MTDDTKFLLVIENERSGYIVQTFNRFDATHLIFRNLFDNECFERFEFGEG